MTFEPYYCFSRRSHFLWSKRVNVENFNWEWSHLLSYNGTCTNSDYNFTTPDTIYFGIIIWIYVHRMNQNNCSIPLYNCVTSSYDGRFLWEERDSGPYPGTLNTSNCFRTERNEIRKPFFRLVLLDVSKEFFFGNSRCLSQLVHTSKLTVKILPQPFYAGLKNYRQ